MATSTNDIRLGVIGLGLVSASHLEGYVTTEGARLAAVCDVDPSKLERAASRHGVTGTTDYRTILADRDIDAVALLLPHQLHFSVAREALEAGKHVCVEKPMTVREDEAAELIEVARSRGLTLAVAENTRFVDAYVEAQRLVAEGRLGEIRLIRGFIPDQILDEWADVDDASQAWKREPYGCGAIIDCGPHMLYLAHWFFGEVEALQAYARGWVPEIPLDNHGIVAGKMADGPLFSFELASVTEYPRGERVEVYGSDGTLVIDQVLDPPVVLYRGAEDAAGTPVASVPYDLRGWKKRSIMGTAADFIDAIRNDREPASSAQQGMYVVRLVQWAYESAARGGTIVDPRRTSPVSSEARA